MAAIDKIYGSKEHWKALKIFLQREKPEYLQYLYAEPKCNMSPISNFSKEADMWLLKHCKIEFVIKAIKKQYRGKND
jgi:hypothetical protein